MFANLAGLDLPIVLLVIVVVLFGSTQIPKLARSLGSASREFKQGQEEVSAPVAPAVDAASADGVHRATAAPSGSGSAPDPAPR